MTQLTKEVLTSAIRAAAVKAESTDERRVLNYASGEIERQGSEIERLKSDIRDLTEAMNRARRTAKDLAEENHALRNPAPAVSADERAAYEAFIALQLSDLIDQRRARNGDTEDQVYMAWDMTVGWLVWQGRAAMLLQEQQKVAGATEKRRCDEITQVAQELPPNSPAIPDGWALVPLEIIDRFPEINVVNYDHDDVRALNSWGCELVLAADPQSEGGKA